MKFHENVLNNFDVTERTRVCVKLPLFNVQRAITTKECNPELRLLRSARRLNLLIMRVNFHENIRNGLMFKGQ